MTNAEKFEEVFGFKANTKICYLPEDVRCPLYDTCDSCPYNKWLDEEYTGISPTEAESEKSAIKKALKLRELTTLKMAESEEKE